MDNNFENNGYSNNNENTNSSVNNANGSYGGGSAPQQESYNPYSYNPYAGNQQNAYSQQNTYGQQNAYGQQNTYSQQGSTDQQNAYTQQNTYGQQNAYSQQGYSSAGSNPYSYGTGSSQSDQPAGGSGKASKSRGHKKHASGGFGGKLAKTAAIACVFGLVAGTVFTGVSAAGSRLLGTGKTDSSASEATITPESSTVKQTSTGYASDLTDVSAIVDEVMPSIVAITNTSTITYQSFWGQSSSYESESCGSGIIIAEDDEYLYISTNNHVVADAEELSVKFSDESVVEAETRGTYPSGDLAVVMVKLSDISEDTLNTIKIATIGDSSALKVGEPAIAIGNALGYGQSVTTGIVSALGRTVTSTDSTTGTTVTNNNLIQTDAAINPGNSGGALLNEEGQVIGINSVKYSDTSVEGIGYAIPMEDAYPILQALIDDGEYVDTQTAYLGITGADVTSDIAQTYNMPEGVYVNSVYDNTGADEAGLQSGDIITQIDDTEVASMDELKAALKNYSAGDTVKLVVYRQTSSGYKGYYVNVTLSSAEAMNTDQ